MKPLTALLACLTVTAAALGQTGTPYLAEIITDSAELRAGPGEAMPGTGPLPRGERVRVLRNVGADWVAVEPPLGQVSWVRTNCLEFPDSSAGGRGNAVVLADPSVEVATGRWGHKAPLDVRKHTIGDGAIVTVIDASVVVTTEGGAQVHWSPIVPVDGEFRYLPRAAIRPAQGAAPQTYTVLSPAPTPSGGQANDSRLPPAAVPASNAGNSAAPPGKPDDWPSDPLWHQAEDAFRAGNYERAVRLYLQLANNVNHPGSTGDPELASRCFARVHEAREKLLITPRRTEDRADGRRGETRTPGETATQAKWTYPGFIREVGNPSPGTPRYSFRAASGPDNGRVIAYLVAGPNVDLDRWREGAVELLGRVQAGTRTGDVQTLTVERVRRAEPGR